MNSGSTPKDPKNGWQPGEKGYTDPDKKIIKSPRIRIPTKAYKEGWDRIWGR